MNRVISVVTFCIILFAVTQIKAGGTEAEGVNKTLSGYIKDENGEELIGANVYVPSMSVGTVTNMYGFYSLTLPPAQYSVQFSFVGYGQQEIKVDLTSDVTINVQLEPASEEIEEVQVVAERRDANVQSVEMGVTKMPIKTIEKIPVLFGETDIIKSIQLLPGVSTIGEGGSGFYVRGGSVDQNLILLDDANVYSPAHVGGLFSVFNSDAIKNVELYKGSIPAHYGGRLSSVLDVRMKEGSTERFGGKGGIGAISSRLTLEAPIINDKASFIVSGRRTYVDMFFPLFNAPALDNSTMYFYDLNGKVNYRLNENNRFFLSAYLGRDVFGLGDFFDMGYGNTTTSFRWNHVFTPRLFSNTTLIYSIFDYRLGQPQEGFSFEWTAKVVDYSLKHDYQFYLNPKNTITFGLQSMHHTFNAGTIIPDEGSSINEFLSPDVKTLEHAIFIDNEQQVNQKLSLSYGLRYSLYQNIEGVKYEYDEQYNQIDSVFRKGTVYNSEGNFEPRLGLRYLFDGSTSLKAGYSRTAQYVLLGSNTTSPTPLDIWYSSNNNIKPQTSDQYSIGIFKNFFNNHYESSVEVYYKNMNNSSDFIDHAQILFNSQFDTLLRAGSAYSYGLEFFFKKQHGDFTGWVSYTLSKTRRKIPGINNGKEYPAPYDRPHDLKIVGMYDITKKLSVSANWVYLSSLPYTVALSTYPYKGVNVPIYSERNAVRFEAARYHRLDFSVTYNFNSKLLKEHGLTLSVYNVYNRHNLYSILYQDKDNSGTPEMYKMYLFKVLPTITYNFSF